MVEVLCTLGLKPAVISASQGLLCSFARDVLAACGQQPTRIAAAPSAAAIHGNVNLDTRRKCELIAAELERDSTRGRQKLLCEQHGVDPAVFIRWRNQRQHSALTSADTARA